MTAPSTLNAQQHLRTVDIAYLAEAVIRQNGRRRSVIASHAQRAAGPDRKPQLRRIARRRP